MTTTRSAFKQLFSEIDMHNEVNWPFLIRGLRAKLRISQQELASQTGMNRRYLGKYELAHRTVKELDRQIILNFICKNNLDIAELEILGKSLYIAPTTDFKIEKSGDLAEFMGLLLGDGEFHRDGAIRISFDPKKEPKYLSRRVFPLIKNLFDKIPIYESDKRIYFGSKDIMLFFEKEFGLKPGNKVKNQWKIPNWCFESKEYITSTLRGLFDTDGYFAYEDHYLDLMFGRFADNAEPLAKSISAALDLLNIAHSIHHRDHRWLVRLHNKVSVLKFFNACGSSNPKHIARFLLWRLLKYSAKIEIEGVDKLYAILAENGINIDQLNIPFKWSEHTDFSKYISEDGIFLEGAAIRSSYNWPLLMSDLLAKTSSNELSQALKINARSVRKWREGRNRPNYLLVPKLLEIASSKLNIVKYKNGNDRINDNGW